MYIASLRRITSLIKLSDLLCSHSKETKINKFFTIPFIPFLSEKIKTFFKRLLNMAYKGINNLRGFIRSHKDVHPKLSHTDVVYKIDCWDCKASYVGQTDRCLKIRINELKNHINWNTTQPSVITEHKIISMILVGKMSILDEDSRRRKRT